MDCENRNILWGNRNILRLNRKFAAANRKIINKNKIPLQSTGVGFFICVLTNFNPTVFDAGYYGLGAVVYVHFL